MYYLCLLLLLSLNSSIRSRFTNVVVGKGVFGRSHLLLQHLLKFQRKGFQLSYVSTKSQQLVSLTIPRLIFQVGDFGVIERATGAFLIHGNLYEHNLTRKIMEGYPPDINPPIRLEKYTSEGVRELGVSANPSAGM